MATAKAARPHYFPAGLIGGFGEPDTGSDRQRVASSLIRPRSAGGIGAVLCCFGGGPGRPDPSCRRGERPERAGKPVTVPERFARRVGSFRSGRLGEWVLR
jgi:hypothetical protein